jgi:hypothetical protein
MLVRLPVIASFVTMVEMELEDDKDLIMFLVLVRGLSLHVCMGRVVVLFP